MGFISTNQGANGFGDLVFGTRAVNTDTQPTERARIDSSGRLMVGTTTAYDLLTVQGGIRGLANGPTGGIVAADTTNIVAKFARMTANGSDIAFGQNILTYPGAWAKATTGEPSGGLVIGTDGSCAYYQSAAGNSSPLQLERFRIDSSGIVMVGKTSTNPFGTKGTEIHQDGGTYFSRNENPAIHVNRATNDGTAIIFFRSGTQVGNISVTTTATAYNTSSDYRLKNTIIPMTGALNKVSQLNPVTYKWNADGSDGEGFVAHELAEVMPHAVTGEKDAVDADGKPQYQGIDTSFLVATLTAAIQEQQALIETLTQRITALEGR
jgi:hypothetical protein